MYEVHDMEEKFSFATYPLFQEAFFCNFCKMFRMEKGPDSTLENNTLQRWDGSLVTGALQAALTSQSHADLAADTRSPHISH